MHCLWQTFQAQSVFREIVLTETITNYELLVGDS